MAEPGDAPNPRQPGPLTFDVGAEAAGERIDRFLARQLNKPRHQIQRWIAAGQVHVNGRLAKPSALLSLGDLVAGSAWPQPVPSGIEPESGQLVVLHEDDALAVLDKPAGLTVHPGAGRQQGTLAHFLLARFPQIQGIGGPGRPGIVHRLDKDTTGLLVVALNEPAYHGLARAFAAREVAKTYLAMVYGNPPATGTIQAPLGRSPQNRKKMAVVSRGRPALTHFRVGQSCAGISWLEVGLATGRTHQIRVHLKHLGHPLIGDPLYGEARWRGLPKTVQPPLRDFPRPALHAWHLAFTHPLTGQGLRFTAPVPDDLRQLWQAVTGTAWVTRGGPPPSFGRDYPRG